MPKTILIVDDEPVVREVCKAVLRRDGFEPIIANDGVQGLETYRQRHDEICLVLSDIKMPLMNGIEMVQNIFEMHSHANVILMSGANLGDLIPDEIRRLCSFIDKPFTPGRLLEAVKKCIQYDMPRLELENGQGAFCVHGALQRKEPAGG